MLNFGHTFAHAIESSLEKNLGKRKEVLDMEKLWDWDYYVRFIILMEK